MEEQEVGSVVGYFQKINVAAIEVIKGDLRVGEVIHFKGHTTDFQQKVESMQLAKVAITVAKAGDQIGIKVQSPVREHDLVYKVCE